MSSRPAAPTPARSMSLVMAAPARGPLHALGVSARSVQRYSANAEADIDVGVAAQQMSDLRHAAQHHS